MRIDPSCDICPYSVYIQEKSHKTYYPDDRTVVNENGYSACSKLNSFVDHEGVQHYEANFIVKKDKSKLTNCPISFLEIF